MRTRVALVVAAVTAVTAACTTSGSTPATAPPTTAPPPTTTTAPPPTTTDPPTTTVDRVAEVTAIFLDLEQRRLAAIATGDWESFEALYANDQYMERDLVVFDRLVVFDDFEVELSALSIKADSPSCLAFEVTIDNERAFEQGASARTLVVLERRHSSWGYSWIGEGWQCDGQHPLAP